MARDEEYARLLAERDRLLAERDRLLALKAALNRAEAALDEQIRFSTVFLPSLSNLFALCKK